MKDKAPVTLGIRKSDEKYYDALKDKDSPFAGKENKELFMMAMVIGFRDGARRKFGTKKSFVRTEYLNPRENSIIKAIAVAQEGNLEVLLNKRKVFSIAEEFAAGGIKLLRERVFSRGYGSYIKKLESDLVDDYQKIAKVTK